MVTVLMLARVDNALQHPSRRTGASTAKNEEGSELSPSEPSMWTGVSRFSNHSEADNGRPGAFASGAETFHPEIVQIPGKNQGDAHANMRKSGNGCHWLLEESCGKGLWHTAFESRTNRRVPCVPALIAWVSGRPFVFPASGPRHFRSSSLNRAKVRDAGLLEDISSASWEAFFPTTRSPMASPSPIFPVVFTSPVTPCSQRDCLGRHHGTGNARCACPTPTCLRDNPDHLSRPPCDLPGRPLHNHRHSRDVPRLHHAVQEALKALPCCCHFSNRPGRARGRSCLMHLI